VCGYVAALIAFEGGDNPANKEWETSACFSDAHIHKDAILGFPWLKEQKLGLFPHLCALAFEHPKQELLRSSGPSVCSRERALDMAQAVEANKCRAKNLKLPVRGNGFDDESLFEDKDTL
jgi:hypothetical protein